MSGFSPVLPGLRRLNINGAIDKRTMAAQVRSDDTIDSTSTIALMKHEAFDDFRSACKNFFRSIDKYVSKLRSLLVENFEIVRH